MKKLLALLLLSSVVTAATGATPTKDGTHRFYGYAFDLNSNDYLYTEVHTQKIKNGKWVGGTIHYYLPDGRKLGIKTLDFRQDPYVPVYTLELPLTGYMEGVTDAGDPIRMHKRGKTGEAVETGEVARKGDLAADSGFHSYLVDHFDELQAGKTLRFKFVVSGYLDTFSFKARKLGETTFEGRPVVKLDISPNSVLSIVAPDLTMLYDPKTRQLLEYKGTSNIHDPKSGDAYEARIVYSQQPPRGAPKKLPPLK